MSIYPEKIAEKLRSPRPGPVSENAICGRSASFVCGCFAEACIELGPESQVVECIGFATNGCGFMTASCRVLGSRVEGRDLADLNGLSDAELTAKIEDELGEFPPERRQCATVAIEALKAAFTNLRKARVSEFVGDSPLVCTCFGVAEDDLLAAILKTQAGEFRDLAEATRAGRGCGACRMLIDELIDTAKMQG